MIALHTTPFVGGAWPGEGLLAPGVLINQFSRFAVPFFFVISGYFWGSRVATAATVASVSRPMAWRIAALFIAWSLIYLLPYNIGSIPQFGVLGPFKLTYFKARYLAHHPLDLLFEGTSVHLWFFVALLCSLGIVAPLVAAARVKVLVAGSVVLYLVGVLGRAYVDTPLGLPIPFDTRNGPFFGTIFFASGYLLTRQNPRSGWLRKGLAFVIFGYAAQLLEIHLLNAYFGTNLLQDFVLGTYFVGLGAAMVALSDPAFLRSPRVATIGRMTLGIYAIHVVFVDVLYPVKQATSSAFWEIGYVFAVLALSVISVSLMARSNILRRIVM